MRYNWEISAASSFIEFNLKYYEIGRIKGYFKKFNGQIIAGNHFENPEIRIRIAADSVSTHNKDCDHQLVSPAFFATKQFPTINFDAYEGCKLSAGGIQELTGELQIRDTKNKITLLVTLSEIKSLRKEINAQFSLTTSILLSDYGLDSVEGILGDLVNVTMRLSLIAHLPA